MNDACGMLLPLTILHPLVDACSIAVLLKTGQTWWSIALYNVVTLILQFPIGLVLDFRSSWMGKLFGLGVALVFAGGGLSLCGIGIAWAVPLIVVCIGNALFHLTAGSHILEMSDGRGGPVGLFISTGAIGLTIGYRFSLSHSVLFWSVLAIAFISVALYLAIFGRFCNYEPRRILFPRSPWIYLLLPILLAIVVWRSYSSLAVNGLMSSGTATVVLLSVALAWAGKAAGGYLADCWGRVPVVLSSAVVSVPLFFFCQPSQLWAWMLLLFAVQLSTGPIISLFYAHWGRTPGTSFGLNCMGLGVGGLL